MSHGRWSAEEHKAFLTGLRDYGREWKKVANAIKSRTSAQIRSHAQKYFAKLAKDRGSNRGEIGIFTKASLKQALEGAMHSLAKKRIFLEDGFMEPSPVELYAPWISAQKDSVVEVCPTAPIATCPVYSTSRTISKSNYSVSKKKSRCYISSRSSQFVAAVPKTNIPYFLPVANRKRLKTSID